MQVETHLPSRQDGFAAPRHVEIMGRCLHNPRLLDTIHASCVILHVLLRHLYCCNPTRRIKFCRSAQMSRGFSQEVKIQLRPKLRLLPPFLGGVCGQGTKPRNCFSVRLASITNVWSNFQKNSCSIIWRVSLSQNLKLWFSDSVKEICYQRLCSLGTEESTGSHMETSSKRIQIQPHCCQSRLSPEVCPG